MTANTKHLNNKVLHDSFTHFTQKACKLLSLYILSLLFFFFISLSTFSIKRVKIGEKEYNIQKTQNKKYSPIFFMGAEWVQVTA